MASSRQSRIIGQSRPEFQALLADLEHPVAPKGYVADPRVSAPGVVSELAQALGCNELSASVYLCLLTHVDPSRERLRRYLDITDAAHDQAVADLLERHLLVAAQYQGSGRRCFLPEPIVFPKAPALPMEASKVGLYGLDPLGAHASSRDWADRVEAWRPPFGVVLPLGPMGHLFAQAWRKTRASS